MFALVAGAGTAITPCVLPLLSALLSNSAVGGRRRPFGVIAGLALTFTMSIVALAQITNGVGVASGTTRTLAVIVQAPLSRLARPEDARDRVLSGGALRLCHSPQTSDHPKGPVNRALTSTGFAHTGGPARHHREVPFRLAVKLAQPASPLPSPVHPDEGTSSFHQIVSDQGPRHQLQRALSMAKDVEQREARCGSEGRSFEAT
jgi:hypothetical protein